MVMVSLRAHDTDGPCGPSVTATLSHCCPSGVGIDGGPELTEEHDDGEIGPVEAVVLGGSISVTRVVLSRRKQHL